MVGGVVVHTHFEMEGVGAGASIGVRIIICIGTAGVVGLAVPGVGLTGILVVVVVGPIVDGEVEGDHTVAAGSVLLGIGGCRGALSVGGAMPCELVAGCLSLYACLLWLTVRCRVTTLSQPEAFCSV